MSSVTASMMSMYGSENVCFRGQQLPSEPAKVTTFEAATLSEGASSLAAAAALIYRQQQQIAAKTSVSSSATAPCAAVSQPSALDGALQVQQGSVTSLYGKLRTSVVPADAQKALSAFSTRSAWLQRHVNSASNQSHAALPASAFKAPTSAPHAAAAASLAPACSASHLMDVPSPEILSALLATAELPGSHPEDGLQAPPASALSTPGSTQSSSCIIQAMLQNPNPAAAAVLSPESADALFLVEPRTQWLQQLQRPSQQRSAASVPSSYVARAPVVGQDATLSALEGSLKQLQAGSLNPPGLDLPCFADSTAGGAATGVGGMAGSHTAVLDYTMLGIDAAAASSMQHLQQQFTGRPQLSSHVAAAAALGGGGSSSFHALPVQGQQHSILLYGASALSGSGCCLGHDAVPGLGGSLPGMTPLAGRQLLLAASPVGSSSNSSSAAGSLLLEHRAHRGPGLDLHVANHGAHNPLYKTEMCRSWQDSGSCRYGGRCQFAHGAFELRPLLRHPKYRTQPCRTFSLTGNCPYGERCTFIHDLAPSLTLIPPWSGSCILQNQGGGTALAT